MNFKAQDARALTEAFTDKAIVDILERIKACAQNGADEITPTEFFWLEQNKERRQKAIDHLISLGFEVEVCPTSCKPVRILW